MNHVVRKLRRTVGSLRPIVHLKSGDTNSCVESARTSEITKDKVSLGSPKSLYLRTTTPNKSLAAQRNVRSLNLVIRTVSEQVSDSLDIVSTPVTSQYIH